MQSLADRRLDVLGLNVLLELLLEPKETELFAPVQVVLVLFFEGIDLVVDGRVPERKRMRGVDIK